MHTHCLADYMDYIYAGDWRGVANLMLSSANKLKACGADFLICPDNTIHHAFDLVARTLLCPGCTLWRKLPPWRSSVASASSV